uniref:Uncharacterized protein n=1 Tax=Strombidium rassoulzadegani TaxID=1082188 RepID=A0A7S3CVW3_9SPIT|mmetsp:Transcript_9684/g.16292  ORF Transcript_9684/g.16292 Transcript_9684/m.16292 type:complete len:155 (+) Transcript_9684:244-708(+)
MFYGSGPIAQRLRVALKTSLSHGKILSIFVFFYKSVQCLLANVSQKARAVHSLVAGMVGAFFLLYFDTDRNINYQICYYLVARVGEGLTNLLIKKGLLPDTEYMVRTLIFFQSVCMLFMVLDKTVLNKSMASTMTFLYHTSDKPLKSYKELIPF